MLFQGYLRNGIVYVPTIVKLQTGAYMNVEPVAVVPVANTDALRRSFSEVIAKKNAIVANPPKDKWPPPVLPKYAGVKSWSAFARGASLWNIEETDGEYRIVGHRKYSKGYLEPDSDQIIELPAASSVDQVIDRMIAILQEAANSSKNS
jgi:hypothetical protein